MAAVTDRPVSVQTRINVSVWLGEERRYERMLLEAAAYSAKPGSDERSRAWEAVVRHDAESYVIACRACLENHAWWDPRHWRDAIDYRCALHDLHVIEREDMAREAGES